MDSIGAFIVNNITLIWIWWYMESFSISRYCPAMWGILGYFWFSMLEPIKRFFRIIWHWYGHIFLIVISIYCQSKVITNLTIFWNQIVLFEGLKKMVCIIFVEIFYSEEIHTEEKNCPSVFLGPYSSCEGYWIIATFFHMRNKLIVGYGGWLF